MKAIVQDHYGSEKALKLEDVDKPEVGDDVLVRVHAASIHVGDWVLMGGKPFVMRMATGLRRPKYRIPGTDVAGTVEAVGASSRIMQAAPYEGRCRAFRASCHSSGACIARLHPSPHTPSINPAVPVDRRARRVVWDAFGSVLSFGRPASSCRLLRQNEVSGFPTNEGSMRSSGTTRIRVGLVNSGMVATASEGS